MCRVTNFTAVENAATRGTDATAYLLPAGANRLLSDNSTTANQCAYSSEANRNAMRGGPWVAITADIPQASIYVSSSAVPVPAPLQHTVVLWGGHTPPFCRRAACQERSQPGLSHVSYCSDQMLEQGTHTKTCGSAFAAVHLQVSSCCSRFRTCCLCKP